MAAAAVLPSNPSHFQRFQKESVSMGQRKITVQEEIASTVRQLTPKQITTLFQVLRQFRQDVSKKTSLMDVAAEFHANNEEIAIVKTLGQKQVKTLFQVIKEFNRQAAKKVGSQEMPPSLMDIVEHPQEKAKPSSLMAVAEEYHASQKDVPLTIPTLRPPLLSMEMLGQLFYADGMQRNALDTQFTEDNTRASQRESAKLHEERLEKLKEQIKVQKETNSWGTAVQVFSWIGSLLSILTGVALIASGVGAVAGAFLIGAGVMTVGSQILEITGGWQKIARLLPDDSPERRAAILSWIQIAITVLSVIMGCVGGVISGFSAIGEAMQFANALFGGIVLMGFGVTQIGKAIKDRELNHTKAAVKKDETALTKLEQKIEDDEERLAEGFSTYQRLATFINTIFRLRKEVNRAILGKI